MLHVISALCVARDLHMIAPELLERTCWRQFVAQLGACKKSRIAPFNAIIISIVIIRRGTGKREGEGVSPPCTVPVQTLKRKDVGSLILCHCMGIWEIKPSAGPAQFSW